VNPDGRFYDDDFVFIDPGVAEREFSKFICEAEDVILCHKGTLGKIGIIPTNSRFSKYVMGNSMMRVRCDRAKLVPLYLYYWLCSPEGQHYLFSRVSQVGVPQIQKPLTTLREAPLRVPPLHEQRAIVGLLGDLDDKIELNRRMNETLEELARTIFKSWFVDFDPVRAKAEGRQPVGVDGDAMALFPSHLVESALGAIPEGWRTAPLGEWATILSGGTPSKSDPSLWGGDLPWISPKVMTRMHADEADAFVTSAAVGNGTRLVPSGSTLVIVRGMGLHKEVRVSQARRDVTFNQDVKALVPKAIESTLLLFALLDAQQCLLGRVQSSGHGTGVLPTDILLALPLCFPPLDVQKKLVAPLDAMNDRIAAGRSESRTLGEMRDLLLPKLISGELRLRVAEKMIEAAL
jgi:type I restriction enzyme S subunit